MNEVANGKKNEGKKNNANIKECKKEIPCKYFKRKKTGCRRGNQCWFYHDLNHKAEKQRENFKKTLTKKFKNEIKLKKETMQEHGPNLMQVLKRSFNAHNQRKFIEIR